MAHGFERVDEVDGIREWRLLANGLTVLSLPTRVAPVATFCVVYQVGSRNEVTGQTGATHLLEHLMFKGTERFNRERGTEIARVLQRLGASFNATTWLDRTNYYATVAREHLETVMEIEADRMRGALVRDEDLASERTVVLNELERGENDPFDLLLKHSFATAYLEHPYHHPTIGWRSDVESVTASVLRSFYDTFYHPDNAVVILTGDVEEGETLAAVERHFGRIPPGELPRPAVHTRESQQRGERRFELRRAGEVGWVSMSWHVPHALHPDLPPLKVTAQVLAEGVTSRLYQRLVESNRCLGVHAFAWELRDPGLFQVFATLAPGVAHREVEDAIREEVNRLAEEGPEPTEAARARIQVETSLAFHRESPAQIASALTEAVAQGDWRRFARELEEISAVTPEDVRRVTAAYLVPGNLTVGWFVPEGGAGAGADPGAVQPRPCFLSGGLAGRTACFDLPGGAQAAVVSNPHAPTVTIAGSLLAGRAFAPDPGRLTPVVVAEMLERGTTGHTRLELARELEDHGLELSVESPSSVPTVVSFTAQGLARELPRLARLLVEVLRNPVFPEDELEKVREHLAGRLRREREETFATAFGVLTRRLYPAGHPRHRPPVELREKVLAGLGRADLEAYHRRAYGPASLRLAVVGDAEPEGTERLLADLLAGWTGGFDQPPDVPAPERTEGGEVRIHIADRPNLDVILGHAGRLRWGDPDQAAAVVANACLGQSTLTSRLGREVRDTAGLTYGIYSRFFGTLHVPGPWAVYLSVSGANLERAVELTRRVVSRYAEEGPSPAELEDERLALAGSYRVGLATNAGVARELVTLMAAGLPLSFPDDYPRRLQAVTREEVLAALARHIHPGRLVVAAAGSFPSGSGPE